MGLGTVARLLASLGGDDASRDADEFFTADHSARSRVGVVKHLLRRCPATAQVTGFEVLDNKEIIGVEIDDKRIVRMPRHRRT